MFRKKVYFILKLVKQTIVNWAEGVFFSRVMTVNPERYWR